MHYPIVIHKDEGSSYGVTVPDLPGCFSGAETLEEAIVRAREAIAFHVEGLLLQGEPAPTPEPLAEHQANPDYAEGVWVLVDVDLAILSDQVVRLNITMPSRVLALVDEAAARASESRSGFLARAALEHIAAERSKEVLSEV